MMLRALAASILLAVAVGETVAQSTEPATARRWGAMVAAATIAQSRSLAGDNTPVAGGALRIELAHALPWRGRGFGSSIFGSATAGAIGNTGDSYDLSAVSLGLRVPLARESQRWSPYVDGSLGARFAETDAADGLRSLRVKSRGGYVSLGVGQQFRLSRFWSIDLAVRGEVGPWSNWRREDGTRPPNESTTAGTLRAVSGSFHLGIRWGR